MRYENDNENMLIHMQLMQRLESCVLPSNIRSFWEANAFIPTSFR